MSALGLVVSVVSATVVRAQCPDGSPPPCGTRRVAAAIDSKGVILLPFSLRGPSELQYLGAGMVDLLQNSIDAIGGYRVIQPSTSERDLRKPASAADIAPQVRAAGARFVVSGSVVAVGPELRVNAELYDVVKRQRVVPVNARTDLEKLGQATDSIALVMFSGKKTVSSKQTETNGFGTLAAAGKVAPNQRLLITEFRSKPEDSAQARLAADALRISLTQSGFVSVMQPQAVADALRRMRREPTEKLSATVARELARREGVAVLLDGDVSRSDQGLVFVVRLTAADSGTTLAVAPANAATIADIPDAMDALARRLRAKIGESLQKIQTGPRLAQVTTSSTLALEKYTAGARANDVERDFPKAVALLKEAVAIDSSFAEAWRKLAAASGNGNLATARQIEDYRTRAFMYRERLSPQERIRAEITYYGLRDEQRQLAAWEEMFSLTNDSAVLASIAQFQLAHRDYARAEANAYASIRAAGRRVEPDAVQVLVNALLWQGKTRQADSVINALSALSPRHARLKLRYDCIRNLVQGCTAWLSVMDSLHASGSPEEKGSALSSLANWALLRGQLKRAQDLRNEWVALNQARGIISRTPGPSEVYWANGVDMWIRNSPAAIASRLDTVDMTHYANPRPFAEMAKHYAWGKRADRARNFLERGRKSGPDTVLQVNRTAFALTEAEIALAEGNWSDAVTRFRALDVMPYGWGACGTCTYSDIGRAYEAGGMLDSAIVAYERYLTGPSTLGEIPWDLPVWYERLCLLHAKKGNYAKAATYCASFVQFWENADPELQSRVGEARRIIERSKSSAHRALNSARAAN
jgi:TolB-like protein